MSSHQDPRLKQVLNSWQVFFIAISGIVGTGIFSTNGGILSHAGPGGYLLALGLVGFVAVAFMDGLSEMAQAFPCANALSEYVDVFVDPELASCVGIDYWMVWGIIWSLMLQGASITISYWTDDLAIRIAVIFVIAPAVIMCINLIHVSIYGWIETVGGSLKVLAIVAVSLATFYLAGKSGHATENIERAFQGRVESMHPAYNVVAALPTVAYSWIGLEIVAVSAFEAKKFTCLRVPSQAIVFCVLVLYLICAIGEGLAIESNNSYLPGNANQRLSPKVPRGNGPVLAAGDDSTFGTSALIVIAAVANTEDGLANFFNVILIFAAFSAANTSLYVASRTLYGFALKKTDTNYPWINRVMRALRRVNKYGVPYWSVIVTAVIFGWIPFLQLQEQPAGLIQRKDDEGQPIFSTDVDEFAQWLRNFSSIGGLIVWNTQLLAYIRYWHWLHNFKDDEILTQDFPELNRFKSTARAETLLGFAQPAVAYFGFVATLVMILILPSAAWWGRMPSAFEVTQTYGPPVLMVVAWLTLKALRYKNNQKSFQWYARQGNDREMLRKVLNNLKFLSGEGIRVERADTPLDEETGAAPFETKSPADQITTRPTTRRMTETDMPPSQGVTDQETRPPPNYHMP